MPSFPDRLLLPRRPAAQTLRPPPRTTVAYIDQRTRSRSNSQICRPRSRAASLTWSSSSWIAHCPPRTRARRLLVYLLRRRRRHRFLLKRAATTITRPVFGQSARGTINEAAASLALSRPCRSFTLLFCVFLCSRHTVVSAVPPIS